MSATTPEVLTPQNTSLAGKPCRIFDADGEEVRWCTEASIKTGCVTRYEADDKTGNIRVCALTLRTKKIIEQRPAPLRVEWQEETA